MRRDTGQTLWGWPIVVDDAVPEDPGFVLMGPLEFPRLHFEFTSENFSILGTNWTARLSYWDKIPAGGPLIIHAKLTYAGKLEDVEVPAFLDSKGTLHINPEGVTDATSELS